MKLALSLIYTLQLALYGLCQSSGPDITPPGFTVTTTGVSDGTSTTSTGATTTGTRTTTGGTTSGTSTQNTSTTTTADFPSLSSYPACVSNCLTVGVAKSGCSSVVDVNCFCTKPDFVQELFRCVTTDCPNELGSSEDLAQRFCNIASASPTLTFPAYTPTSSTTSMTSSTTQPAQTDTAGNSAGPAWPTTALLTCALATTLSGLFLVA